MAVFAIAVHLYSIKQIMNTGARPRFHGLRHPRDMGAIEVESFLTDLAVMRKCAPSTHKQALAALLFLYREVLTMDLPWMQNLGRPTTPVRIPVVLSRFEVAR